jgi:hypothetical protein
MSLPLRIYVYVCVYLSACLCVCVCGSISLPVCLNGSPHGQHKLERHQDNSVICSDLIRQGGRNAQILSICRYVYVCLPVSKAVSMCWCMSVPEKTDKHPVDKSKLFA